MEVLVSAAGGAPVPRELRHVADVVQEWGGPRGWRVARDVDKAVLQQFPGTPFHAFRRKQVPVVASGSVDGAPAALLQVDFTVKYQSNGGSTYSSATGGMMSTGKTKKETEYRAPLVVELPAPVPKLEFVLKRDPLDEILHVAKLNRWFRLRTGALGTGVSYLDRMYHLSGSSVEYVRSVFTPERAEWLYTDAKGPLEDVVLGDVRFRLSGRRLIVWSRRNFRDPAVIDGLIRVAQEIRSWIPQQAFQDPAGVQADQGNVPLSQVQLT
ncbi:hypothetical protein IQ251_10980 [Saccharopolyspora sp. HNM0983]|uniref:Uncharacterized protein n=1 Tax=Saccharopolyspora montiporae TaxID=2781240 RepID=A0A929G1R9_9PSEU|nr:hypothetical protein [Saccharopolyspora sp. HNM0983]MBE9374963.1 hypothetical protein [Saccharopolyspora sp. HNM0983]